MGYRRIHLINSRFLEKGHYDRCRFCFKTILVLLYLGLLGQVYIP